MVISPSRAELISLFLIKPSDNFKLSFLIKLNFKKLLITFKLNNPFTLPEILFSKKILVAISSFGILSIKLFLFSNELLNFIEILLFKKLPFKVNSFFFYFVLYLLMYLRFQKKKRPF